MNSVTSYSNPDALAAVSKSDLYTGPKAVPDDNIMSGGINVLYKFMTLFSDLAQGKYDYMSSRADRSRNSQQTANEVDSVVSQLKKADSTGDLPPNVILYMRDHQISVTVQNDDKNTANDIDAYLNSIEHSDGKGLNKGQLDAIKGALEGDSGRCSDVVTQSQLQIQKTMQSYNVSVSSINSMQTLLSDMNKAIAQNIR